MPVSNHFDVIVCGAGPGGSTTALFLAKKGKKVLLIDKEQFPRDKTCADNKSWICTGIVKELGLWPEFQKLPKHPITGMLFSTPAGHEMNIVLDKAKIKKDGPHYNVRRFVFDHFLFQSAKKNPNVTTLENASVEHVLKKNGQMVGVRVKTKNGSRDFFSKVIVAADGSQSPTAVSAGFEPVFGPRFANSARAYFSNVRYTPNTAELHYLPGVCPGYFWIFPVDNNWCNVGVGSPQEQIERSNMNLEKKLFEIIHSSKFNARFSNAKQESAIGQWGVTIGGPRRPIHGNGIVLVGDAANTAVTFAGEGVGPAMRSGKLAAQAIAHAFEQNDFSAKALNAYSDSMWQTTGPENKAMWLLEFLATHPRLFDWAVSRAKKNAWLHRMVSKIGSDYKNANQILSFRSVIELLKG